MKIEIENNKEVLYPFVVELMKKTLIGKKADIIVNGEKTQGKIKSVETKENRPDSVFLVVGEEEKEIPIFEETKGTFGLELIMLLTKRHSTVIEFE